MTSSKGRDAPDVGEGVEPPSGAVPPGREDSPALPTAETDLVDDGQPTAEWIGGPAASRPSSYAPGQVVGDRYRIRSLLGRGGMGEVWQAFDLKLRVEVALKSVRKELFANERGLELLRREVLSAREVVSPNVCRVFDLQVADGQELVSMEYIDGRTLLGKLSERGPLELAEASKVASQLLAGLAAIHDAGLVHRDLKPENVMITRSGRVVVMDFGIAKAMAEGSTGTVAGTPAYMAPEQMRGEAVDARTDVFATGVMLAEMVGPEGIGNLETRRGLWAALREQPPRVPEGPWEDVIRRAVAADPEDRYRSARALTRALEEVTLRVEGADNMRPYPGLASFTEADAEFFFGREAEVEALWKKLQRPHLLGLIGPSGAGKSSFLHAGLIPARPEGWRVVVCQPDDASFRSLARALVPELSGDTEAIEDLVGFDDIDAAVRVIARWRAGAEEALLVIDQFEELFTLNPPEVQARFATLLGRLPVEADVRVLLSMRDDFLFRCHEQAALAPLFSELTPLGAPGGADLRRALVQPALACGYRFEDEALVEEMLGEVTEERGALPLLAFAAARLWEMRDRGAGMLTRRAYDEVGGVGGALAQHAEATLDRLGATRRDQVREVFRNLVTSEGTRATCEIDELVSVFDEPERALEVVKTLIDARLLTSYEVPGAAGEEESHRVEIVHESLLAAWPRLVRWQTQDADGAQLRDQLRQAAKVWDERERTEDLLWSGSAYLDYRAWRERYTGGLSATGEAFAQAMVSKANRQRKRRRIAAGVVFVVLAVVLGLFGVLWRQSERAGEATEVARQEAVDETRRAEASKLVALGRVSLETEPHPSAAVAYALESLEQADGPAARQLALEALFSGPTAMVATEGESIWATVFSPDGQWLASVGGPLGGPYRIELWASHGGAPTLLPGSGRTSKFGAGSDFLVSKPAAGTLFVWSVPGGERVRTLELGGPSTFFILDNPVRLLTLTFEDVPGSAAGEPERGEPRQVWLRTWPLLDGGPERSEYRILPRPRSLAVDAAGRWLAYSTRSEPDSLYLLPIEDFDTASARLVGRHSRPIRQVAFHPAGNQLLSTDGGGEVRFWSLSSPGGEPLRVLEGPEGAYSLMSFDRRGSMLAVASQAKNATYLWQLDGPPDADPLIVERKVVQVTGAAIHPDGQWLAIGDYMGLVLWPLGGRHPQVLRGHSQQVHDLELDPAMRWMVSSSWDETVRLWPLDTTLGERARILFRNDRKLSTMSADPAGGRLAVGDFGGKVHLLPVGREGAPRSLTDLPGQVFPVAFEPQGRVVAAAFNDASGIHLWNLETDEVTVIGAEEKSVWALEFAADGRLISGGNGGVRIWDLADGSSELLREGYGGRECVLAISRDAGLLLDLAVDWETFEAEIYLHDLERGGPPLRVLQAHGNRLSGIAIDTEGKRVITGTLNGFLQVGPITGERPHQLWGGPTGLSGGGFSPDGRWIVSGHADGTIRLWPVPEGQPFHTLPHEELLDRLRALTNLRAVKDDESLTGYRIEAGPFQGWEEEPTW